MSKKFLFYLSLILVVACSDEEDPSCEMTKFNIYLGTTLQNTYDVFFVDDRLSVVTGLIDNQGTAKETWFITVTDDNISDIFYEADGTGLEDFYTYTYADDRRNASFVQKRGADIVQSFESSELYLYGETADGIYFLNDEFIEMQNGNVVRTGFYAEVNGENVINPAGQVTYTYDNEENILRDFFELPGLLAMPYRAARINSRNNMIAATGSETETNIYKYDENKNLLNFIDGASGLQLTFSYNCK